MIYQRIYIPSCDWEVCIAYDARPKDADYIIDKLIDMGCPNKYLYKAERLLKSGNPNEGLTYSNKRCRETFIVIGHVTDPFQLIDTISHEKQHLEQAICLADQLDPYGEDIAYISGNVSAALARNAWHNMKKFFLYLI